VAVPLLATAQGRIKARVHVTQVTDPHPHELEARAAATATAAAADLASGPAAAAGGAQPAKKRRKGEPAAAAAAAPAAAAPPRHGHPLDGFRLQQALRCVVLGRLAGGDGHRHGVVELSVRPSHLAAAEKVS
jgi:hypothetical protein